MTVPAHILRASLDDALEVVALTDTRAKELVADVLADILALREHNVDEEVIDRLLDALRRCCALNADLMAAGQRLSRTLDDLARAAHHSGGGRVKDLAAELRPHLNVIADAAGYGTDEYVDAVCALNDLIEANPFDRFAGGGMFRALGPGRHALLMGFVRGVAEPQLAQHISREQSPVAGSAGGEAIGRTPPGHGGLANSVELAA